MSGKLILIAATKLDEALAGRVLQRLRLRGDEGVRFELLVFQFGRWGNGIRDLRYDTTLLAEADAVLYVSRAGFKDVFMAHTIKTALGSSRPFRIVEPFNGSCRQDREDAENHRPAFGPQLAGLLVAAVGGDTRIETVTPHSAAFMENYPNTYSEFDAIPSLLDRVRADNPNSEIVMCAVDEGVTKRWPQYDFGIKFIKSRNPKTGATVSTLPPGQLTGKHDERLIFVFIDDEWDSGGSMRAAMNLFRAAWMAALPQHAGAQDGGPHMAAAVVHSSMSGENAYANLMSMREQKQNPRFHMYTADTRLDRIDAAMPFRPSDAPILTVVPVVEDLLVRTAIDLI